MSHVPRWLIELDILLLIGIVVSVVMRLSPGGK